MLAVLHAIWIMVLFCCYSNSLTLFSLLIADFIFFDASIWRFVLLALHDFVFVASYVFLYTRAHWPHSLNHRTFTFSISLQQIHKCTHSLRHDHFALHFLRSHPQKCAYLPADYISDEHTFLPRMCMIRRPTSIVLRSNSFLSASRWWSNEFNR